MDIASFLELAQAAAQTSNSTNGATIEQVIAGAGVGAAAGAVGSAWYTQRRTDRRERQAAQERITGIARVLYEDFRRQQSTLARGIYRAGWWRPGEMLKLQVTDDDIKRIASAVDATKWGAVSRAIGWMAYLRELRGDDTRPPDPTAGQLELFRDIYRYLDLARFALHNLAKLTYRPHNGSAMKRDAVEEARGHPARANARTEMTLSSLGAEEAQTELAVLGRKWGNPSH